MKRIQFRKAKISIENIGRQRFWIGIVTGTVSAGFISLIFNYSREVFRFLTGISGDLLIFLKHEQQFFDLFFSTLASVLGLSITIWIWMDGKFHRKIRDRKYKQLAKVNAILIFWVVLLVTARFGSIIPNLIHNTVGFETNLNIFKEFWLLFVLIPIVVFAHNWFCVRLVYRTGKWIAWSFLFCVIISFTFYLTATVNQEKLNNTYYQKYEKDYNYIDAELSKALANYRIHFEVITIDALKKWHSKSSIEQIIQIKRAFTNDSPVTIDTIVLQKIIIKNFKHGGEYHHDRNSIKNWPYALPKDISRQIGFFNLEANETKELFNILKEQIDLVNTPELDRDNKYKTYSETEIRRIYGARYNIPLSLIIQLKEVRDSLAQIKKYSDFVKELPEISNERAKQNEREVLF